jgi:uncharacterized protein
MRKIGIMVASFAALMMLIGTTNTADAKNGYGKQKVAYHINYPGGKADKKYKGALRNIQNHINAVGKENLDLKVVVHGNGIFMMKTAKKAGKLQSAVASLKSQDVNFSVCANTLKGKKLGQDELYEVFDQDIVPSGVAELSKLQQQGYTYIKP